MEELITDLKGVKVVFESSVGFVLKFSMSRASYGQANLYMDKKGLESRGRVNVASFDTLTEAELFAFEHNCYIEKSN